MCVTIIQRWPYGSRSEPARSPWNWSAGGLTPVAPGLDGARVERVGVLGVDHQRDRDGPLGVRRDAPELRERVADADDRVADPQLGVHELAAHDQRSRTSAPNARS